MINQNEDRKILMEMLYQTDLIGTKLKDDGSELYTTYQEIINEQVEIDDVISNNLFNYTLNRLAYIDRAIIRLAVYELKYTETPAPVIINEAIILTKAFSDLDDEKQHKFNNKLLDNINKDVRGWYNAGTDIYS